MPRPPDAVPDVASIPTAVFSPWVERLRARGGPLYPLHVGDTWLEPFDGARVEALSDAGPGLHRYGETRGLPELVDAVLDKVRARNGLPCEREGVVITGGATAALAAAVATLAAPGEEVLILAPYWPLIRGVVQTFRAQPVEVPFYDRVQEADEAVEAVRRRRTSRTVALYVSTPSNPTGRVLPEAWLAALADWARRENLWIVSDEVYEDFVYRGRHVSLGRFAPERTLTAFSFSKAYAMAGDRLGYLVGPADAMAEVLKVTTRTVYCAPTPCQRAGLRALRDGGAWLARARETYRECGAEAASRLGVPAPEGATYLFLDLSRRVGPDGVHAFLAACAEDGVLLAPGDSCGADYEGWVRLCFTACAPKQLRIAIDRLARRLDGLGPAPSARAAGA